MTQGSDLDAEYLVTRYAGNYTRSSDYSISVKLSHSVSLCLSVHTEMRVLAVLYNHIHYTSGSGKMYYLGRDDR